MSLDNQSVLNLQRQVNPEFAASDDLGALVVHEADGDEEEDS